jgi:hypothetical protein
MKGDDQPSSPFARLGPVNTATRNAWPDFTGYRVGFWQGVV